MIIQLIDNNFKINILKLRQGLRNFYIQLLSHIRDLIRLLAVFLTKVSVHRNNSSHTRLPTIALPTFAGDTCSWLHFRDTFEALVVNNTSLSNVQRFHYLIASLKNETKDLISNLQITNEIFLLPGSL